MTGGSGWGRGEFGLVGGCCGVGTEMVEIGDIGGSRRVEYVIKRRG